MKVTWMLHGLDADQSQDLPLIYLGQSSGEDYEPREESCHLFVS